MFGTVLLSVKSNFFVCWCQRGAGTSKYRTGWLSKRSNGHLTIHVFRFYSELKRDFLSTGHIPDLSHELVISFTLVWKISKGGKKMLCYWTVGAVFLKIVSCYNAPTALLVQLPTYTPSAASKVAVTFVARTLSMDANWISFATISTLTMFTCAREERTQSSLLLDEPPSGCNDMTRLTLPPVLSASLPMSARQQSVPSNVITDMMTLWEKTLTICSSNPFFPTRPESLSQCTD